MVDTFRTQAQIAGLLADNNAKNVSAQDLRDAVLTLRPVYAEIAGIDNTDETPITTINTVTPVTQGGGLNLGDGSELRGAADFTNPQNGRIVYEGAVQIACLVIVSLSARAVSNNKVFDFYLAINGSEITNTRAERKFGTTDTGALSLNGVVLLGNGDFITTVVANRTDTSNIVIVDYNLSLIGFAL